VTTAAGEYRRYPKSGSISGRDVFCTDYLMGGGSSASPGTPFNSANWAHWPGKGLVILWTDGSTSYPFSKDGLDLILTRLYTDQTAGSFLLYDELWNDFQVNSKE
jgi:hypothetical protein